jgi:hypothetical protein
VDVVGEESIVPGKKVPQRSAKWGLSNRSDECKDVRRCMKCGWNCVSVDRLTRSLEAVPVMLGVPPLLHNRRFA